MKMVNNFKNYYVADFETITDETNYYKEFKRTGITYGVIKNFEGTIEKTFNKLSSFFEIIKSLGHGKIVIYFHNLGFDGSFIISYLDQIGFIHAEDCFNKNTFHVFRTTNPKIYYIRVNYEDVLIEFRCSKLILQSSVKALGKNVNIEKYKHKAQETNEFYNVEPINELEEFEQQNLEYCDYCKRDVEIVRVSLLAFYEEMLKILNAKNEGDNFQELLNCYTLSSISFLLQRVYSTQKDNPFFIKNYEERIIADKFKQGGLTLVNNNILQKEQKTNVIIIDLKSAYPAVMANQKMAYKYYGSFDYNNYEDLIKDYQKEKHYYYFVEFDLINVVPKNGHDIPLLKNFSKNKLVTHYTSADIYHGYYLLDELIVLLKFFDYKEIKIRKVHKVLKKMLFRDIVNELYHYKEKYKKEGDLARSHTYKILLNAGYGVHCKRWDYVNITTTKPPSPVFTVETSTGKKITYVYKNNIDLNKPGHLCYMKNNKNYAIQPIRMEEHEGHLANVWIANTITSFTRIKIMNMILKIGIKNFAYSDTDSVFIMNKTEEEIKQYCGDKLGDWEIEKGEEFDYLYVARKKMYVIKKDNQIKKSGSAGFDKNFDISRIEEEKEYAAGLVGKLVDGGMILTQSYKTISLTKVDTAIIENEYPPNYFTELKNKILRSKHKWQLEN